CTFVLALFLGFGKRRQELVSLGDDAASHRRNLDEYSLPFLDHAITMTSTLSVIAYAVYSIESATAQRHPGLWISTLLVLFGVCRYLWLVYHKGQGGAPDELLLTDRVLQLDTLAWLITVGLVLRGV
ncbi:MAG: decaprenyl-phosphate phosphoribosyltransferase, partial [Armatimonadetes bacterium]|nr:decaprenyl-phosphate phosphoribosyltransferase [Armatimonadota bacterium]